MRWKASKWARPLDKPAPQATLSKGSIVEVIANPREGLEKTRKYIGEPAEVVIVLNDDTVLLRFIDDFMMTVDRNCIKEL